MLDNSRIASSQRSWSLAGLGNAYNLQPHPDALHRGYGWGRYIDSEFFTAPVILDFRGNAAQATGSVEERTKTNYPLIWH